MREDTARLGGHPNELRRKRQPSPRQVTVSSNQQASPEPLSCLLGTDSLGARFRRAPFSRPIIRLLCGLLKGRAAQTKSSAKNQEGLRKQTAEPIQQSRQIRKVIQNFGTVSLA
jgi:hypothetical protein